MYSICVVEGGISAGYFLDKMQYYEMGAAIKGVERSKRAGWEQARMVCVTSARAMGAKIDSKKLKFPWETEIVDDAPEIDEMPDVCEMRELKAKMKTINLKK